MKKLSLSIAIKQLSQELRTSLTGLAPTMLTFQVGRLSDVTLHNCEIADEFEFTGKLYNLEQRHLNTYVSIFSSVKQAQ